MYRMANEGQEDTASHLQRLDFSVLFFVAAHSDTSVLLRALQN